ncbi:putative chromatin regulator PHD family [Helianthus debilis subsp. tardiflorus]
MVVIQHEHPLTLVDLNPKYPCDEYVYDDEEDLISIQAFQCPCDRCDLNITFFHRYYYKCNQCDYSLHKLCYELPITLEHTSHLAHTLSLFQNESQQECHVCRYYIWNKQLCYYCSSCMLNICLNCGKNEAHHHTIYHPSHRHPLIPINRENSMMCDACGKHHQGIFYQCITCFLSFIYEDCIFSPKRLLIQEGTCDKFFHTHPLILTYGFPIADQQAKFNPRCRVCNKSFSGYEDFWVYKCEKCRYYTHHHCAYSRSSYLRSKPSESALNLKPYSKKQVPLSNRVDPKQAPSPITIEELEDDHDVLRLPLSEQNYNKVKDFFLKERNYESSITHDSHEHPLILVDAQCNDIATMNENDSSCNACLVSIVENTSFYKCKFNGQGCNFLLHEWCTRLPPEIKGHKYHQEHTLRLDRYTFSRFVCGVCDKYSNGFAYWCVQCGYTIDVWCAFTRAKITHKSHPNHLLSRNCGFASEDDYCRMCLSGFTADNNILFGCDACEFHLHAGCAFLLPETIRHRYDKHPLSLAYSPIENHEGDYFCEVCEEELNPNAWFYHCHECVQSIHTTCAPILLPQSKPYLYGGLSVLRVREKERGIYKPEYHPHPLSFKFLSGTSKDDCTQCGRKVTSGCIFKCSECKFVSHETCLRW